jgi:nitrite reductase/ring-hydroxylating ferredoxin subunit
MTAPHPWEQLYARAAFHCRSRRSFLHENLNMAAQFRDYLTPGDLPSAHAISPGSGAVLRDGLHKIAAYRDDDGALHCVSAVCPHLKSIVRWNGAERTWDCPCHGSRFDAWGKVLTGPANSDLNPVHDPAAASVS